MRRLEVNGHGVFVAERRPRFWSEGNELRAAGEQEADGEEEEAVMVPPLQRRDRSRSEPSIQREVHRMFGRELRRISDEFHHSYETLVRCPFQNSTHLNFCVCFDAAFLM